MDYLATPAPSSLEERIVQVLASGPATRGELCARLDRQRLDVRTEPQTGADEWVWRVSPVLA